MKTEYFQTIRTTDFWWAVSDLGQVITVTLSLTLLYIRDLKPTLNENITNEKLHFWTRRIIILFFHFVMA